MEASSAMPIDVGLSSSYLLNACGIAAVLFFVYCVRVYIDTSRPKDFPPGPPTVPFLGNLHQILGVKPHLKFREWGDTYGTLIGLKFSGTNVVVINHLKQFRDLYEKKGAMYHGRPPNYIVDEVYPNEIHLVHMDPGDNFRRVRKVINSFLNQTVVHRFLPIQEAEATQTMVDLLEQPDGLYEHIRRFSTAVILASAFGQRGPTFDSPRIQKFYHMQRAWNEIIEFGYTKPPIEVFPWTTRLPAFLLPWKRKMRQTASEIHHYIDTMSEEAMTRLDEGRLPECLFGRLLTETDKSGLSVQRLKICAHMALEAGSETTASSILTFILAMVAHPRVLKKLQAEVDSICDDSTFPTNAEALKMPYLDACIREVLRWRPVIPGGLPHMILEDDVYEGYKLPAGTVVLANTWAIQRDPELFQNPDEYIPERYIETKSDHRDAGFGGSGRRFCLGMHLALQSLRLVLSKIVWLYDLEAPVDEHGKKMDVSTCPQTAFTAGGVSFPERFPCVIKP